MFGPGKPDVAVNDGGPVGKNVGGAPQELDRRHGAKIGRAPLQEVRA
jgi:hypothetical protein